MNDTGVIRGKGDHRPVGPRCAVAAAGTVAIAALTALDGLAGPGFSSAPLGIPVVMGVAWWGRRSHATALSVLSAAGAFAAGEPGPPGVATAAALLAGLLASAMVTSGLRDALAAAKDPLTGAMDRRAFLETAERERARAERLGEPVSVAYLDVDDFKAVNDRHGHRMGDRILAGLAERVRSSTRATDLFCRMGGDEFALLLPGTGAAEAAGVLRRARTVAGHPHGDVEVTVSIGIATFLIVPTTVEAMLDAADGLMYRAKRRSGDRLVGAVVGGPWLRWDPPRSDPALSVDTVTVRVEIIPAEARTDGPGGASNGGRQRASYTRLAADREPQ